MIDTEVGVKSTLTAVITQTAMQAFRESEEHKLWEAMSEILGAVLRVKSVTVDWQEGQCFAFIEDWRIHAGRWTNEAGNVTPWLTIERVCVHGRSITLASTVASLADLGGILATSEPRRVPCRECYPPEPSVEDELPL